METAASRFQVECHHLAGTCTVSPGCWTHQCTGAHTSTARAASAAHCAASGECRDGDGEATAEERASGGARAARARRGGQSGCSCVSLQLGGAIIHSLRPKICTAHEDAAGCVWNVRPLKAPPKPKYATRFGNAPCGYAMSRDGNMSRPSVRTVSESLRGSVPCPARSKRSVAGVAERAQVV